MITGLEQKSDESIEVCIRNLKAGVLKVVDMGDDAFSVPEGSKESPPVAAFQLNMSLLETFQAEAFRRGMDYDAIGPDIREIEEMWLEATE